MSAVPVAPETGDPRPGWFRSDQDGQTWWTYRPDGVLRAYIRTLHDGSYAVDLFRAGKPVLGFDVTQIGLRALAHAVEDYLAKRD